MATQTLKDLLPLVSRPSRYVGGEVNAVRKGREGVDVRVVLAFPDIYEVGMSHLGLRLLYHLLNDHPWIAAERVYAPWPDMEKLMRQKRVLLVSLESSTPIREFDVVGFSLQYELCYTNVLNILDLSGIPLHSHCRNETYPLVIGGGPCSFNPEPLVDFFDAMIIGDGEEVLPEVCAAVRQWKKAGADKGEILTMLAELDGVYIPSFFEAAYGVDGAIERVRPFRRGYEGVTKRVLEDLGESSFMRRPLVPFTRIIHDRLDVEVARGCTRGCRFCQAGMICRPVRDREPPRVERLAADCLASTGYDEMSLASLSTGDYPMIGTLLKRLMNRFQHDRVAISLPSLRVESLTSEMIEAISRVRKTGFTIAPEAGTQRLRDVINKGISEKEILSTAERVFLAGWKGIKLYFMIGLPTETREDLVGIVELVRKISSMAKAARGKRDVHVSLSTFVPKPHTPFQWEPLMTVEEIEERHRMLRSKLRGLGVRVKWQDPEKSMVEAAFARGDRKLSQVLVRAFHLGCRLDEWSEHFKWDLWRQAFHDTDMTMDFYNHRFRSFEEIHPWSHIDCGVQSSFLLREREKAMQGLLTPDCREAGCRGCGVCQTLLPGQSVARVSVTHSEAEGVPWAVFQKEHAEQGRPLHRYRLKYTKREDARFLSHLEVVGVFSRALRRAGVPLRYSAGFHPLPRISFSPPLPVGYESLAEYVDVEVVAPFSAEALVTQLRAHLPPAIRAVHCLEIPLKLAPLSASITTVSYVVSLAGHVPHSPQDPRRVSRKLEAFASRDTLTVEVKRGDGIREVDLRPLVKGLFLTDEGALRMVLRMDTAGHLRPTDVAKWVYDLEEEEVRLLEVLKVDATFNADPHFM